MSVLRITQIVLSCILAASAFTVLGLTVALYRTERVYWWYYVPFADGSEQHPHTFVSLAPKDFHYTRPITFLAFFSILVALNAANTGLLFRGRKNNSQSPRQAISLLVTCSVTFVLFLVATIYAWYDAGMSLTYDQIRSDSFQGGYEIVRRFKGSKATWDAFNWNCAALPAARVGNKAYGGYKEILGKMELMCGEATAIRDLTLVTFLLTTTVLGLQLWAWKNQKSANSQQTVPEKTVAEDSESEI